MTSPLRPYSRFLVISLLGGLLASSPALAVNKEMVQLQTQVQELQDAVARLQQSNDERMGVLKDLVQQSADSVNKMSGSVDSIQRQLQAQREAEGGKVDQVAGQVQSLNDSLDEIKARLGRLEKLMQDVQSQQQSANVNLQGAPAAAGTGASAAPVPAGAQPSSLAPAETTTSDAIPLRGGKPSAAVPLTAPDTATAPAPNGPAPPVDQLYKTALGDYMAAKYGLSQSEFADVTRFYPDNPLSGSAFYYQGEIEYRGGRYGAAIKDYDRVIEAFPESNKVAAAHLHKGQALIQLKQQDAGVRELRSLIQRFPNSPEATQARSRLNGMGITIKPRA